MSKLTFIAQNCDIFKTINDNSKREEAFKDVCGLRIVRRVQLSQNEWNLRFINENNVAVNNSRTQMNAVNGGGGGGGVLVDSVASNDNDLSDLCQLLDSSFGLIDHIVDIITHTTNYIVIVLTCALMLKPFSLFSSAAAILRHFLQNKLFSRRYPK